MDEDNVIKTDNKTEFYLGTVTNWYYDTKECKIQLDGQDAPMTKRFKSACGELRYGSRVVVAKMSGTYIVIGVVDSTPYIATNILNVADNATGIGLDVTNSRFARWGKVAMLYLRFTPTTTFSNTTKVIATLKSGYRPVIRADAQYWAGSGAYITPEGEVTVNGSATSTTSYYAIYSTYILA